MSKHQKQLNNSQDKTTKVRKNREQTGEIRHEERAKFIPLNSLSDAEKRHQARLVAYARWG